MLSRYSILPIHLSVLVCGMLLTVAGAGVGVVSGQSLHTPVGTTENLLHAIESSSSALPVVSSDSTSGEEVNAALASSSSVDNAAQDEDNRRRRVYKPNPFTFEIGAGFNAPMGNDQPYITWGGNLTVGAGFRLSKHLSLMGEYQFIDDKLPGNLIAQVGGQYGNAYIHSITLAPILDLFPRRTNSMYLIAGGGFYHKVTNFSSPQPVLYCDYFGDCGIGYVSSTVYEFSTNQGGFNAGIGFTHKLRGAYGNSRAKLYAEARYLFINTPPLSQTNGLGTTELIPVTLGVRW